jgi:hypothetical protein
MWGLGPRVGDYDQVRVRLPAGEVAGDVRGRQQVVVGSPELPRERWNISLITFPSGDLVASGPGIRHACIAGLSSLAGGDLGF